MRNSKYKMKIEVTGGNNVITPKEKKEKKEPLVVTVDMKNKTAESNRKKTPVNNESFFKKIRETYKETGVINAAKLINLEFKKVYIKCIGDGGLDVDTNKYLDSILFDSIENHIGAMLASTACKNTYDSYGEVFKQSIANSVEILDYGNQFDFDTMNSVIDDFIRIFK